MKFDDTDIGGAGKSFITTHWSMINEARGGSTARTRVVIEELMSTYWKPVYCYLRRKGYGNEKAKDLTQGFFHEVVLGRKVFQRATNSKGRFRNFLLSALNRYLVSVHRKETAQKRSPAEGLVQLHGMDPAELPSKVLGSTDEESFHYAWISGLLDRAITEVEAECASNGLTVHWQLFDLRVLQPVLNSQKPPSLRDLCAEYGIGAESKASNMIVAVKRRFRACLKRQLRQSVSSECEVNTEFQDLMQFFPEDCAR